MSAATAKLNGGAAPQAQSARIRIKYDMQMYQAAADA
jgi:hypothetical protein